MLDVWHLENILARLYEMMVSHFDKPDLYGYDYADFCRKCLDFDSELSCYLETPQRYGYGSDTIFYIGVNTFELLYHYIVEQEDFDLALDLLQPEFNFDSLILRMGEVEQSSGRRMKGKAFLCSLRDFLSETQKWATVYSMRAHSSIDKELAMRERPIFSILLGSENQYRNKVARFDFSRFFSDKYDKRAEFEKRADVCF